MDDQSKEQDLVINGDGSMGQGTNNDEPKIEETQTTEPDVNSIIPPAEESNSSESNDDSSVESAVNFIAGGSTNEAVSSEDVDDAAPDSSGETIPVKTESSDSADDVKVEPVAIPIEEEPVVESSSTAPEEAGNSPENETQEQNNSSRMDSNQPSEIPASNNTGMSNNEQSQPHAHRNNKKLATIVTILVALLFAAGAVYVYVSAQDNTVKTDTSNIEINKTTTVIVPATSEDIDQIVAEIDETINSLSEEGLEEESLTDETLGIQ